MLVRDWRLAEPELVAPLFAAERRRWREQLHWDTTTVWTHVEQARRLGYLPGLLISDSSGRLRGWSFHLLHETTLQVGGLVTDSAEATAAWLEAIGDTPEAMAADRWLCFGCFDAPGLIEGLRRSDLDVGCYRYLQHVFDRRGLAPGVDAAPGPDLRAWQHRDLAALAPLLAAAYPGADHTRPFAPTGTAAAWTEYGRQIVEADANGSFDASLSLVMAGADGELDGAVLVTKVAATTAHIAQLVVRPDRAGHGLGRALLRSALQRARQAGCHSTTLLVGDRNVAAQALYRRTGFVDLGNFVSATKLVESESIR